MLLVKNNDKLRVVQQVINPKRGGGVTTEYISLTNSEIVQDVDFIPMILPKIHKGVNIKDISFYYKFLKKEIYDIVHIRGSGIDSLNAIIAAKLVNRGKIYTVVHGEYSDMLYINKVKKFFARRIVEPLIYKLSDYISFLYEKHDKYNKVKKKKLLPHVYNRYPEIEYQYEDVNVLKDKLFIEEKDFVFVYVGRITREKGLDFLIKAIKNEKIVKKENFKFVFVGDGDYLETMKSEFKKEIKTNKIIFTGNKDKIGDYYKIADAFISPTLHENHSISLLEAIISKTPIIITKVGGNAETISNKDYGILIEPSNVEQLVDAILSISDKKTYKYYKNNLNEVDERFLQKNVNKVLLSNYIKIMED